MMNGGDWRGASRTMEKAVRQARQVQQEQQGQQM